jgi:LacI family transcriptional regulator
MSNRANPTLHDVAAKAGVTVGTASRALDPRREAMVKPATRDAIKRAAEDLGYQINTAARGLRRGVSDLVGVVISDFGNPIIAPIIRGIEDVASREGFQTFVTETRGQAGGIAKALSQLTQRRAAVIVVTGVQTEDGPAVEKHLQATNSIPLIFALRELENLSATSVILDDEKGGRIAGQHLLDLGHKLIAEIPGPSNASPFRYRSKGFKEAVSAYETASYLTTKNDLNLPPTYETGHQLAQDLLSRHKGVTGIFAHNDLMAIGAIDAIREVGLKCPEDVSVVGFDDSPLMDHIDPPLTTVRLPGEDIGHRAGYQAIRAAQDSEQPPIRSKLEPRLVLRASTQPLSSKVRKRS